MPAFALLAAVSAASLNLCTDEYLLLLARPREIASVSFLSRDAEESPLWKAARQFPGNRGSLEQTLKTRPTAVLTMGGGGRATGLIARKLGLRVVALRPVVSLDDVAYNLRAVAAVLGDQRRAEPWLLSLDRLRRTAPRRTVDAIWLSGGGQSMAVPSAGADWLRLAGLRQRPLPQGRATLETMLVHPPAVIVESRYRSGQYSLGTAWLNRPTVRWARSKRLTTDGRAWTCRGPLLIEQVQKLRAAMR
jgi:iron complex transport system substrate-binding protein